MKAGGFLQHDWSDADVAFANASCFDEELLGDLAAKCALLKEGALVVTLGEQLVGQDHLELVLQRALVLSTARASSGATLAFVHRRISPEGDASSAAPATTPPRPRRVQHLASEGFAPLTSPQDSELMRRKRAGPRSFADEQGPSN